MGKNEAIKVAAQLGNHTAVEFTGGIVHGFQPIPNEEFKIGGMFPMYGFIWRIIDIQQTKDLPTITIQALREL